MAAIELPFQLQINRSTNLQGQPRKRRARTSAEQLEILQDAYTLEPMPCAPFRAMLSGLVGLSSRSIQIWFQNKRQKGKLAENRAKAEQFADRKDKALAVLQAALVTHAGMPPDVELDGLAALVDISIPILRVWFANKSSHQADFVMAADAPLVLEGVAARSAPKKTAKKETTANPSPPSLKKRRGDSGIELMGEDLAGVNLDGLQPSTQITVPLSSLNFMNQAFLLQDSSLPYSTAAAQLTLQQKQRQLQALHQQVQIPPPPPPPVQRFPLNTLVGNSPPGMITTFFIQSASGEYLEISADQLSVQQQFAAIPIQPDGSIAAASSSSNAGSPLSPHPSPFPPQTPTDVSGPGFDHIQMKGELGHLSAYRDMDQQSVMTGAASLSQYSASVACLSPRLVPQQETQQFMNSQIAYPPMDSMTFFEMGYEPQGGSMMMPGLPAVDEEEREASCVNVQTNSFWNYLGVGGGGGVQQQQQQPLYQGVPAQEQLHGSGLRQQQQSHFLNTPLSSNFFDDGDQMISEFMLL